MMRFRRGQGTAVALVFTLLLCVAGLFQLAGGLPRVANALHFALPGDGGMPYRISFNGRLYADTTTCAGATWCAQEHPGGPDCAGADTLRQKHLAPSQHVGDVVTLIGASHPIYLPESAKSGYTSTMLDVERDTSCWLVYVLEGGP